VRLDHARNGDVKEDVKNGLIMPRQELDSQDKHTAMEQLRADALNAKETLNLVKVSEQEAAGTD
jgi:hypothetical protein